MKRPVVTTDYLITGTGIMGLALAREFKRLEPDASICIIEKEPVPAWHASGRIPGSFTPVSITLAIP